VGYSREKGVTMRMGEGMAGLDRRAGSCVVRTTLGGELVAEVLVAGLGIVPGVELAEQAGLRVDNGIVVDEACRTSQIDIYAAGDVANFANPALGTRLRVEHEDNANTMGRIAGLNMAGRGLPTITRRFSTPTCSSWATKPWVTSTPGSRRSPTGRRSSARGSSTT